MPFGDQGFVISAKQFFEIGTFDEGCDYGEDHLLTWQAKKAKVPIRPLSIKLNTSGRNYLQKGWLQLTLIHQFLWLKQLISQNTRPKASC
jgi:hypothetical protein